MNRLLSLIQKKIENSVDVKTLETMSDSELEDVAKKVLCIQSKFDDPDYLILKALYLEQFRKSSLVEINVVKAAVYPRAVDVKFAISIFPQNIVANYEGTFELTKWGIVVVGQDSSGYDDDYRLADCSFPHTLHHETVFVPLSFISDELKKCINKIGEEQKFDVGRYIRQLDDKHYKFEYDKSEFEPDEWYSSSDE